MISIGKVQAGDVPEFNQVSGSNPRVNQCLNQLLPILEKDENWGTESMTVGGMTKVIPTFKLKSSDNQTFETVAQKLDDLAQSGDVQSPVKELCQTMSDGLKRCVIDPPIANGIRGFLPALLDQMCHEYSVDDPHKVSFNSYKGGKLEIDAYHNVYRSVGLARVFLDMWQTDAPSKDVQSSIAQSFGDVVGSLGDDYTPGASADYLNGLPHGFSGFVPFLQTKMGSGVDDGSDLSNFMLHFLPQAW